MKKKVFIPLILLLVLFSSFIQVKPPVKKVYGYKQSSIPGILPNYSEENDIQPTGKSKPKQNYNYWFYIEFLKTEKINITGLWVSGIRYDIKSDSITDLPVRKIIFTGMEKNDTTVMVPVTKNKIILVYPSGESKIDDSKYALDLARLNELVVRYTWKNKIYYTTMKKLKELNPDVRQ
ncbi:MAG TPA: hypothetical protein VGQ04_06115 [Chitinophagaceae bacterium]|jgi:hypothetical protein|nr:hypothetical protein [Chitinophagaceae bacterium]